MVQPKARRPFRHKNYFLNMSPEVLKNVAKFYIDILRPPSQSAEHDSDAEYDHHGFIITRPTAAPSRLSQLE